VSPSGPVVPEPDYLIGLMARPRFAGRLSPEEALSVACADELRRLAVERKLRAVWFRVPNEHPAGGRLGQMAQAKAVATGAVPGAFDLAFLWDAGAGGVELKVEKAQHGLVTVKGELRARAPRRTYQRERQRDFQRWCFEQGVSYALARRVGEMLDVLREWGRLDG
jgi:hypothetical protein